MKILNQTPSAYLIRAAAAALLATALTESVIADLYSIDILIDPHHPGFTDSWLFDINNQGQSTGFIDQRIDNSVVKSAVIYQDGAVRTLASGNSAGFFGLSGFSINNHGDVVGNIDSQPYFFGAGGSVLPITVPGYDASLLNALNTGGLNDAGNALLSVYPPDPANKPPGGFSALALWNSAGATLLSTLDPIYPYVDPPDPNDPFSGPSSESTTLSYTSLNQSNQFAGGIHQFDFDPMDPNDPNDDVFTDQFTNAFIYNGVNGYSLLEVPAGVNEIRPISIDEAGTVFGWADSALALWSPDGALQSLLPATAQTLDEEGSYGFPSVQRNNLGQVIALTLDGGALLYDPNANEWSDITPAIDGLGTGMLTSIQGFNDDGQFVGLVRPSEGGGVFGYVVSPVPEPTSIALLGASLVTAGAFRWRRRSKL